MWAYYNYEGVSVEETCFFETKEEACRFVQMATQRNMEEYPNEPAMWSMIGEDIGIIFEVPAVQTAEEALAKWFGEDI